MLARLAVLGILLLAVGGCATTGGLTNRMFDTMDNWDIELDSPAEVRVGWYTETGVVFRVGGITGDSKGSQKGAKEPK